MTADKSAAPPVAFSELLRGLEMPPTSASLPPTALYAIGAAIARQAKQGASPPIPAGQEVRMLTDEESDMAVCDGMQQGTLSEMIQRKFCEVNAGKTIPKLAPATTKEK